MNGAVERELKLAVPDAFSLARMEPRLDPYVAAPVALERLHTVYYDTDDLRLTRWGCSLRYRGGEGWTLKLPVPHEAGRMYRAEHVFPGDGSVVPPEALDLATAFVRGAQLRPVAELRTLRASRRVRSEDGEEIADVVEDDVHVVEGTRVVRRFRQIEIELAKGAPDEALDELAALLRDAGAGEPDPVAKNVRALGERATQSEIAVPPPKPRSPAREVMRAAFAASLERLVRQDPLLRLSANEDAVHDARVATRRLRSDLRTFRPLLDETYARELRERLRFLQDGFAAARDADVLLARIARHADLLASEDRERAGAILEALRGAREAAYGRMLAMLREPRYAALLQELVELVQRPPCGALADEPAREVVPEVVDDAWSALRKRVRRRSRPPSNRELHRIRIAAKRTRYAAEAAAPVLGRSAEKLASAVEAIQTTLGDQHDAVVACGTLRAWADDGAAAFAAGELTVIEQRAAAEGRYAWRKAWKRARRAR
ncbi:MAG TPA: CYTH and CHAD domain-containing protein [Candidatus Elarobacter sp.]|nr:CYTH and CHAD domain-containing protein [Candidatus Elarobacter sp.]